MADPKPVVSTPTNALPYGTKVLRIRTNVGIHLGADVMMSVDSVRNNCELFLHPSGVVVKKNGTHLVPYTNIVSVVIE